MDSKKNNCVGGASFFQMPLHSPRYAKKDQQDMPAWLPDRLLAEYGRDSTYKREFAIGAFLRPDHEKPGDSSPCRGLEHYSTLQISYLNYRSYFIVNYDS
ncbi:hypothetical protein NC652_020595 [Populus alba x Populus x berolinensis]|nr:hypothetical protein NC652_020595 [Populus alba x Populus x berolinensis]